jgi:hypothetical protein
LISRRAFEEDSEEEESDDEEEGDESEESDDDEEDEESEDDEEDDESEDDEEDDESEDEEDESRESEESEAVVRLTKRGVGAGKKRAVKGKGGSGGGVGGQQQVLLALMKEQESALKGLKRDAAVLRSIHEAWSMTEEEAVRQGVGKEDLILINAFDGEDANVIKALERKVNAMVEALESEFGQHVRSYEKTIHAMGRILETRTQVINRLDLKTGIFSRYPELSTYVMQKQDKLASAMEGTQKALMDGFATSLAKVKSAQGELDRMMRSMKR